MFTGRGGHTRDRVTRTGSQWMGASVRVSEEWTAPELKSQNNNKFRERSISESTHGEREKLDKSYSKYKCRQNTKKFKEERPHVVYYFMLLHISKLVSNHSFSFLSY